MNGSQLSKRLATATARAALLGIQLRALPTGYFLLVGAPAAKPRPSLQAVEGDALAMEAAAAEAKALSNNWQRAA